MKFLFAGFLIASTAPMSLQASAVDDANKICSIIDRYAPGSYHYFDCLNHIESIDPTLNLEETIDFVCSAVDTFYTLIAEDKTRCFKNAHALLNPEGLACFPEQDVLSEKFKAPEDFDADLVKSFQKIADDSNNAYRSQVVSNNGLVTDLQKIGAGCFADAYSISLDGKNPLKEALKECVFTDINAYSGPAVSPEQQEALAQQFVNDNWEDYSFRKIMNASLLSDPIRAFNTRCVLEVRSRDPKLQGQVLLLAGYTVD